MSIEVTGRAVEGSEQILTPEALAFVELLHRQFGSRRMHLLHARKDRRRIASKNGRLDFLEATQDIRNGDWQVAPIPAALRDRRTEITGPTDRKMTINALNSGAKVWLADQEDASTPHWTNVIGGQVSLFNAIRNQIDYTSEEGKSYALATDRPLATIVMRPRGWHLDEAHVTVDGEPVAGGLFDFALYFFHNAQALLDAGKGPYFYLPKMESHLEARLWNEIFTVAQRERGIPHSTIRATVLIETIPAAFEMEEILYELRDHIAGLNAGRWDYLFSVIKYFRDAGPSFVLPDRSAAVGMTSPFMKAYAELLVKTCHKRGAFAMGGMSAFIPSRRDAEVNERAFAQVRADKEREAEQGFDGSWVAHPDLVPICTGIFDEQLGDKPNQLDKQRPDVEVTADELLAFTSGATTVTLAGVRANVDVGVRYLESWLRGVGAVAIHNLMEDAATAEISRSQLWQWVHNAVTLDSGEVITKDLVIAVTNDVMAELGPDFDRARTIFEQVALADEYVDFLTLPAYDAVLADGE